MTTGGYLPTRDEMAGIVTAARGLYRVIGAWRRDSALPGYPVEMGSVTAVEALFTLEVALNPRRLSWHDRRRVEIVVQCWPAEVRVGVVWLRRLTDLVLARHHLEHLVQVGRQGLDAAATPQVISVADDEFKALRRAVVKLPRLGSLPEPVLPRAAGVALPPPSKPAEDEPSASVMLFTPTSKPLVFGKPKAELTLPQYRVVKALIAAGPHGMKVGALRKVTGDAVNVLKRLAKSDEDWGAVIILPGQSRNGYRLDLTAIPGRSTQVHSTSPQQSTQIESNHDAIIDIRGDALPAGRPAGSVA